MRKTTEYHRMNLQLFAEPGPEPDPIPEPVPAPTPEPKPEPTPQSFDDVLKNKDYQAEFDRRVQKALGTAKEKWEALMDDKLSEADKLAKMTKDEKVQYQQQKREKELADKEAAITRRELMAEAKNTLSEKGLPVPLAELLNYTDADNCSKSIVALEKAFAQAVQAQVDKMLEGGKPPKKAPQEETVTMEQFEKFGYKERLELKTNRPELYNKLSGK